MSTPGEYESEAIAVSKRLKMAIFYRKGIKNHKPHYEIFRRTPAGTVTRIKETSDAATLARYMNRQELASLPQPKASKSGGNFRSNPARRFVDEDAARDLASRFHGRAPDEAEYKIVDMPKLPDSMTAIGKVFAVEYIAERDGKEFRFRHVFKAPSRPHLAVAPDGKFVTMIGGSWHFTEDGFEDL